MFDFETEVNVEDEDTKRSGKATIRWKLEFEMRNWGVKGFVLSVPDQDFSGWLEKFDYGTEENFNPNGEQVNFRLIDVKAIHPVLDASAIICPEKLVIENGKFVVEF